MHTQLCLRGALYRDRDPELRLSPGRVAFGESMQADNQRPGFKPLLLWKAGGEQQLPKSFRHRRLPHRKQARNDFVLVL